MVNRFVGGAFARRIGDRILICVDIPDVPGVSGETVYRLDDAACRRVAASVAEQPRVDVTDRARGRRVEQLLAEGLYHILREEDDGPDRDYLDDPTWRAVEADRVPIFYFNTLYDEDTSDLVDRHRLMLRAGVPDGDLDRSVIEAEIRSRLGSWNDTTLERIAWSLVCDEVSSSFRGFSRMDLERVRKHVAEKLRAIRDR